MKRSRIPKWQMGTVIVLALAAGALLLLTRQQPTEQAATPVPAPIAAPAAGPVHPLEPLAAETPLPPLEASDAAVIDVAANLFKDSHWRDLLQLDNAVRRWVVTIDALPRERLAQRMNSVHPVGGTFLVGGEQDALVLSSANYSRYEPYVALAEAIDPAALVRAYRGLYPLFQQAYTELVRPDGYFNDRLIEVLDHLLATPDFPPNTELVQPSVAFRFADAKFEAMSVGRKALVRMGPDNARRVKAVLERVRAEVIAAEKSRRVSAPGPRRTAPLRRQVRHA
jgi:hypothetical protein